LKKPNLSGLADDYLEAVDADAATLFHHALAIQHAPRYRSENADALRLAWPRVPLPATKDVLETSGALGREVAALLDVLQPVGGVTSGTIRSELRIIGNVSREGGGALDESDGDLGVRASWGYRDSRGAIMAGGGRAVERDWTPEERAAIAAGCEVLGLDLDSALLHLGATAFDVYLNDVAFWKGVPLRVWTYTMGGYRVLKKWLSYRDADVLGRDLMTTEVREARDIARRIASLLLLEPRLDANYAVCAAAVRVADAKG